MKTRACLKCHKDHDGKYQVCRVCLEAINTEWKSNAQAGLQKMVLAQGGVR